MVERDHDYAVMVGGGSLKYDVYDVDGRNLTWFGGVHTGFSPADPRGGINDHIRQEKSLAFELGTRYKNAKKAWASEITAFFTKIDDILRIEIIKIKYFF